MENEIIPYYKSEKDNITILNANCLDIMKYFKDQSFDVIITSPPYNMRTRIRNGKYAAREKADHFSKKYSEFNDNLSIDEYFNFHKKAIQEMLRIAKTIFINFQIVTGSKEAWFKLIGEFNQYIKDIAIWDKGSGQPAMHNSVINRCFELILILETQPTVGRTFANSIFKRGEMQDIWRIGRGGKNNAKGHSATFPNALVEKILKGWKSDTILDPFVGTGTTLIVAKKLGKKAVGIDVSEKYCSIAKERLKNTSKSLNLFFRKDFS